MMKNNSTNFYITSQPRLDEVISLIKQAKLVALDTEFTRTNTYYPILSIIQIAVKNSSGEKECFIIDCLSDIDLSGLFAVIAEVEITKILHSPTQDLQIFYHKSGLLPHGIVDTQIMANFCGLGFSVGYSSLVEELFQKQLDKKQQRSDWQNRPLSAKQIEYALLDVIFLEEIYDKFCEILSAQNRLDWFFEEMKSFVNKTLFRSDDNLNKNFSFRGRSTKEISKIKNMILWRESWAQKVDLPRQHFVKDEVIERIVCEGVIPNSLNLNPEMRDGINKILDEEENFFEEDQKNARRFHMNERQKNCYSEAKKLIAKIAFQENFKEQFLMTSSDLEKVICDQKLLNEIVSGWRYQLFGKELEQLISNFS